jgi:hypothetical protein
MPEGLVDDSKHAANACLYQGSVLTGWNEMEGGEHRANTDV